MNWSGHWHGYGPWIGQRPELTKESLRRPGQSPDDDQTRVFLASTLPPLMMGWALLRRGQTAPERTWTTVAEAVDWLTRTYADSPPQFTPSSLYPTPDDKLRSLVEGAEQGLPSGSDVVWAYYGRGVFVHYQVNCCPPNPSFHKIPCPLPPR